MKKILLFLLAVFIFSPHLQAEASGRNKEAGELREKAQQLEVKIEKPATCCCCDPEPVACCCCDPEPARIEAVLRVISTTSDLASIAEEIGRGKIEVVSLIRGTQDPHFIEPRPPMVTKIRDADLLIDVGTLTRKWVNPLVNASGNFMVKQGRLGRLDISVNIEKLDVPDPDEICLSVMACFCIIYGNPHFWVDPKNAQIIASDIARRLSELSPKDAPFFQENLRCFNRRIDERLIEWQARLEPFRGEKLITFHNNWPYFAQRFGLIIADELEPRPGIPPSPAHLREIIDLVRREDIRVILQAVFYDERPARFVARKTGARVVVVPNSIGGTPEAQCYFSLIDIIVDSLVEAWEE